MIYIPLIFCFDTNVDSTFGSIHSPIKVRAQRGFSVLKDLFLLGHSHFP